MSQFTEKPPLTGDSIDRINPYERNPRRRRNPRYDEIRASLLARGFDGTLNVTQRSDKTDYTVDASGNTCLVILQNFRQEKPRDPRFVNLPCYINPWANESQVLTANRLENVRRRDTDSRATTPTV